MLFNSYSFLILFLPFVFFTYWFVFKNYKVRQNIFLLVMSYFFYGFWNWRFLFLIAISSLADYFIALYIDKEKRHRKRKALTVLSIAFNLGILGFFKYYDFFITNVSYLLRNIGIPIELPILAIVLPVGISFYTFQTMSYTIDVYRGRTKAEKNILSFLCYVSFFPQLVAGPIERASSMLPQFNNNRFFSYENGKDGARLILWGLFLKVFISGSLAHDIYLVFESPDKYSSIDLFIGQISFYVQLYCDFAGYSYIAIGLGKLFGFKLSQNFKYPFFADTMRKFWASWHITLTVWFRDYFLVPMLKLSSTKQWKFIVVFLNLFLIGLWHGANWTYVVTFVLFSVYYIPSIFFNKKIRLRNHKFLKIIALQFLVTIHLVFFREDSIPTALHYLKHTYIDLRLTTSFMDYWFSIILITSLVIVEFFSKSKTHPLENFKLPVYLRWPIYIGLFLLILSKIETTTPFVYFKF